MFSINAYNTYNTTYNTQKEWSKNLFVLQLWPTASKLGFFSMQKLYYWYVLSSMLSELRIIFTLLDINTAGWLVFIIPKKEKMSEYQLAFPALSIILFVLYLHNMFFVDFITFTSEVVITFFVSPYILTTLQCDK